jgi:mono/diheme cytochrome c family protein
MFDGAGVGSTSRVETQGFPHMCLLRLLASLFLLVTGALAGETGDPQAGYALAGEICGDCHSVEAGDAVSPNPESPSFQSIASKPEISELALTVFFQTSHPSMPNLIVTGKDAHDLVAYILSLKP